MSRRVPPPWILVGAILLALVVTALPGRARAQDAPAWAAQTTYSPGSEVVFEGKSYRCLLGHTSQTDWTPTAAPSLWAGLSAEPSPSPGPPACRSPVPAAPPTPRPTPIPIVLPFEPVASVVAGSQALPAGNGWVANAHGTDTATSGKWEMAAPQATASGGLKQLGVAHDGTHALVTGALAGASAGAHDVDGGVTSIESPPIALPADARLTLWFWYTFAHGSNSSSADFLRVEVVGPSRTLTVLQENGSATNLDAAWKPAYASLDPFAGQTITLRVTAADLEQASLVEAALDSVAIEGYPEPPRLTFSPYVDVAAFPPLSFVEAGASLGARSFTLAYVVDGGGCTASWGGALPLQECSLPAQIGALRGGGGDVIASFGGAAGTELAVACPTVESVRVQYQAVIDRYGLTQIDLDIAGAALFDRVSIDRRNKAVKLLRGAEGRALQVSYSLPVQTTGLTPEGLDLLRNAIENGVQISLVNLQAQDFGPGAVDPFRMGEHTLTAATSVLAQLETFFPAMSDRHRRGFVGLTPMIGWNDIAPQVFTLADAQVVADYARQNRLGRLSMWSLGRDRPCSGAPLVSPACSGIAQTPFAFAEVLKRLDR